MAKYTPHCAVLLAAYNGERWISEQIQTILQQKGVDVSLFVSVDFSTDSTLDIVQSWEIKDRRVQLLSYGDKYGSAGKNFFRLIKDVNVEAYDLVAFADQDDLWFNYKLNIAWRKIFLGICDVHSSDVLAFWDDRRRVLVKKSYPQVRYDYYFEAGGPGCTYVFSAVAFNSVRSFIKKNYCACGEVSLHDWLIYAYCREMKFRWHIDSEPSLLYRQHANNQMGTNNNLITYWKRVSKIRSKWYQKQIKLISDLVGGVSYKTLTSRKFIILNIRDIRRRPRDRIFLLFLVLVGLF